MLLWTFVYKFLFGYMVLFHLGVFVGVDLLIDMVTPLLIFWETAQLFYEVAATFYIPINNIWES